MTALLTLLGLFALATLAARPGAWTLVVDRAALPLWLGAGALAASPLFGLMPPWLVSDVRPVVVVAVGFVALLAGAFDACGEPRALLRSVSALVMLIATVTAGLALAALLAPQAPGLGAVPALVATSTSTSTLWAAALFVSAGLVGSVVSPTETTGAVAGVLGMLGALVVASWSSSTPLLPAAAPLVLVGGGALLAVVVRLLSGRAGEADGQRVVVVAGALTLASGVAVLLHQPIALVAVVAGLVLRQTEHTRGLLTPLLQLRRPLFAVLAFMTGAALDVDAATAAVGGVVAVVVVVVRAVYARVVGASLGALSTGLSTSPLALALWVSVVDSGRLPLPLPSLLAVAVVVVVVVDSAAAVLTLFVRVLPDPPPPTQNALTAPST